MRYELWRGYGKNICILKVDREIVHIRAFLDEKSYRDVGFIRDRLINIKNYKNEMKKYSWDQVEIEYYI